MDFTSIHNEYLSLQEELHQVQKQLTKSAIEIRLTNDHVYPLAIPLALRKTITTRKNRETREKQDHEKKIQTLRNYFQEHNMKSEVFDPTPYEIPHGESFTDMTDVSEYQ